MPPRKSDPPRDVDAADEITIEDLTLPKSIITRLAKGVLPPNTQVQANAILALSKSATVFINYLAAHANEHTVTNGKKTIAPADVFTALDDVELGFMRSAVEAEFARFNQLQTDKRNSYRQRVRAKEEQDAPRAKKQKVDGGADEDDAETEEEEDDVPHEDEDEDEQVEEEVEEEEEEEPQSSDETQDALEEKPPVEEADDALGGDESD